MGIKRHCDCMGMGKVWLSLVCICIRSGTAKLNNENPFAHLPSKFAKHTKKTDHSLFSLIDEESFEEDKPNPYHYVLELGIGSPKTGREMVKIRTEFHFRQQMQKTPMSTP
jgi:hypothetical protein